MRFSHVIHPNGTIRQRRNRRKQRWLSLGFIVVVLTILLIATRSNTLNWYEFYTFFFSSLISVVIGYFIAALLAVILALASTKNKFIENILVPVLDVAQSFPTFALIPVLLVLFSTSRWVVVIFLVVTIIWPITFTLIAAIKSEREDLSEAATIYGAHGIKRLRYYRLPDMLPAFVTGSIIGWGEAWEALIGAEIIAKVSGVGAYLGKLGENGGVAQLVVGITMYLFLIFVLNEIIWIPLLNYSSRYQNE
ncbi:ABC transporter permease subunit [Candidatus Saccharibacteria bacterium]|nr:ABC transporter permease subunit [Candidatus Saccharibacteria bacterium]